MYKFYTIKPGIPHGHIHKIWLIMRLTTLILIVTLIQVSAAASAQRVTLNQKKASLEKIFREIHNQTGYDFLYNREILSKRAPVDISVENEILATVLHKCLDSQSLEYSIEDKMVVITEKQSLYHDKIKSSYSAPVSVRGKVTDTIGTGLPGATISVSGQKVVYTTASDGTFLFNAQIGDRVTISFVGYKTFDFTVTDEKPLAIILQLDLNKLNEVVVSTGYQRIPAERATGSFSLVDNRLLNRRVSTDILSRLEDVTPGLIFNRTGNSAISIRGQSTISANANPLIVIDNFPYDGDISNLNPNDVESISVLKDAAAASIWGARAGNGVIVITTKAGRYNQATRVSLNANVTIGRKPDQFYIPQMSTADFIAAEKKLFAEGYYTAAENDPGHPPLTPVIELLIAERDGTLTPTAVAQRLAAFGKLDVRNDISRYLYRPNVNQQYSLSLNGGSASNRYFVSGGYDKNLAAERGNGYERLTFHASNTYSLLKHKLEIGTEFYFTSGLTPLNAVTPDQLNVSSQQVLYPYARLADAQGNPLSLVHGFNTAFVNEAAGQGYLDWQYKPLNELRANDYRSKSTDYRINASLRYKVLPALSVDLLYQYGKSATDLRNLQTADNYYTRNLINSFSQLQPDGSFIYPIPLGGVLDQNTRELLSHNVRLQLNLNKTFGTDHYLSAIGGAELRNAHTTGVSSRAYGYDDEHASSRPVDYTGTYPFAYDPSLTGNMIPDMSGFSDLTDRFVSYYGNVAYTYKGRYTLSGSGRLDQSNLFGVNTNQKGVPLYSAGLAWSLSEEGFYKIAILPQLKLRATYGYNGNIDKSLSAYTTANYFTGSSSVIGQPFARIVNPPNPELRWEKIRVINLGLDFQFYKNMVGGSVEYYFKNGQDLIGATPYAPQTGISSFRGNTADTRGQGVDISLNTLNLNGRFKWSTNFFFSYVRDKVSRYLNRSTNAVSDYLLGGYPLPTEGKPLYGIYSFAWGGLEPQTGEPQGYVNGELSREYAAIKENTNGDNLIYNGPGRPTRFGAVRNTFSYRHFSLSANISFRLGYYVRRSSVNYTTVLTGNGGHGDYALRWQQPGDEQFTQVPVMPALIDPDREDFYTYASVLVEKGDHIRFQDVNLGYELTRETFPRLPFSRLKVYAYANNLGILWKATKTDLDPDYQTIYALPPVRTIAFGLQAEF